MVIIDIIIPTCKKDLETLEIVIKNAKKYITDVNNIYVISDEKYTDNAIHIPETLFPFTINDIKSIITFENRAGWYYQQLLKLYAYKVIPNISENILILDSETIFYKPISFITEDNKYALYCISTEKHRPYYIHMNKLLPGLNEIHHEFSGIVHHMLFQKDILDSLFNDVEKHWNLPLWKAMLINVDPNWYNNSGMSEYEIYFCYIHTFFKDRARIRPLKWDISSEILENSDYDFLTAHAHIRYK
uniref:Glycosyltransferase n=1 Tax=viral metagenome TaxID=1070528 RepID=A0A6C0KX08_9ZZZZ